MKVLLVGATGTLGTAVAAALRGRGHRVVTVGRTAGDIRADVSDPAQTARVYADVGDPRGGGQCYRRRPVRAHRRHDARGLPHAYRGKVAVQAELVRQGTSRLAERGSFTLIAGVLGQEPIVTGSAAAMVNGAVESFVRAAALEISPQRVNAVSPTVFAESMPKYEAYFPGITPVGLDLVSRAYVRSLEGAETGRVFRVQ